MNHRFNNLLFIVLLAAYGCSPSTGGDEPVTPDIRERVTAPAQMPKDDLERMSVSFSHPDGLFGTLSYDVDMQEQFSRSFDGQQTRFDTTWTPDLALTENAANLDARTTSTINWDLRSGSEDVQTARGAKSVELTPSPYFAGAIPVSNILDGSGVDGYITFQDDFETLEVVAGQAQITRGMKLEKEALEDGRQVLFESPGYVNHNQSVKLLGNVIDEIKVIPQQQGAYDFAQQLEVMQEDENGNDIIHRFERGTTLDVYLADMSVYRVLEDGLQRTETDDPTLRPGQQFIDDFLALHQFYAPILEEVGGLDVKLYVESQTEEEFPIGFPDNSFLVGSEEDAPFNITQFSRVQNGKILLSHMTQQVFAGIGSRTPDFTRGVCLDGFQSLLYSPENPQNLCKWGVGTPSDVAAPVLTINYSFKPLDGYYRDLNLTGKDGQSVSQAWYVRD